MRIIVHFPVKKKQINLHVRKSLALWRHVVVNVTLLGLVKTFKKQITRFLKKALILDASDDVFIDTPAQSLLDDLWPKSASRATWVAQGEYCAASLILICQGSSDSNLGTRNAKKLIWASTDSYSSLENNQTLSNNFGPLSEWCHNRTTKESKFTLFLTTPAENAEPKSQKFFFQWKLQDFTSLLKVRIAR